MNAFHQCKRGSPGGEAKRNLCVCLFLFKLFKWQFFKCRKEAIPPKWERREGGRRDGSGSGTGAALVPHGLDLHWLCQVLCKMLCRASWGQSLSNPTRKPRWSHKYLSISCKYSTILTHRGEEGNENAFSVKVQSIHTPQNESFGPQAPGRRLKSDKNTCF